MGDVDENSDSDAVADVDGTADLDVEGDAEGDKDPEGVDATGAAGPPAQENPGGHGTPTREDVPTGQYEPAGAAHVLHTRPASLNVPAPHSVCRDVAHTPTHSPGTAEEAGCVWGGGRKGGERGSGGERERHSAIRALP